MPAHPPKETGADLPSGPVCVTGASGFVASHVVRALLERGHTVRATVRDVDAPAKTEHLRQIAAALGASERLSLHRADLLEPGSFDAAVDGCEVVCHTAAVARLTSRHPQRDIVDPSVLGCRNVLGSVRRAGSVRRVVHTSSIAAVMRYGDAARHTFTEDDWNTEATLRADPYGVAKTHAERAMWEARGHDESPAFELIALHPGLVLGEAFSDRHTRGSNLFIRGLLSGAYPAIPPLPFSVVDARDVALAHALAAEGAAPSGRYLLVSETLWVADIARVIGELFPELGVPRRALPVPLLYASTLFDRNLSWGMLRRIVNNPARFDTRRARERLGVRFRPAREAIEAAARAMIDRGFVTPRRRRR